MRHEELFINGDEVKVVVTTNLEGHFQALKKERETNGKGFSQERTLRKIASIPIDTLMAMGAEGVEAMNDPAAMKRLLNKRPELRTSEGSI